METLLERWCDSRPWCRLICMCLGIFLVGLAAWSTVLRPVERQCTERQQQLVQEVRTNASLWPSASKTTLRPETQTAREMMPFSPLDFQGALEAVAKRRRTGAGIGVAGDPRTLFPAGTAGCAGRCFYDFAPKYGVTPAAGAGTCEIARSACWFVPCCY